MKLKLKTSDSLKKSATKDVAKNNVPEAVDTCTDIDSCLKVVNNNSINEADGTINDLTDAPKPEEIIQTPRGSSIYEVLDRCERNAKHFYYDVKTAIKKGRFADFKAAHKKASNTFNPLFIGPTGAGKTSLINAWAESKGYEVVPLNLSGDPLEFSGIKDISNEVDVKYGDDDTRKEKRVQTIRTSAFDPFLTGGTKILFLDEINTLDRQLLVKLYDLISFHVIMNGDTPMFLPTLLFTTAAMNPESYGNGREEPLDTPLLARMEPVKVSYDTEILLQYLIKNTEEKIADAAEGLQELHANNAEVAPDDEDEVELTYKYGKWNGILDIFKTCLESKKELPWLGGDEQLDSSNNYRGLLPRTIEAAVNDCDGTKRDFLASIKYHCGDAAFAAFNTILSNFTDKEHPANKVWQQNFDVVNNPEEDARKKAAEIAQKTGTGLKTNAYDQMVAKLHSLEGEGSDEK